MLCYHATSGRYLGSIWAHGLQRQKAQQRRKAVWLCSRNRISWAVSHAMRRHDLHPDEVVVVEVNVPDDWIRGYRHPGLYYCERDVPPDRLGRSWGYDIREIKE